MSAGIALGPATFPAFFRGVHGHEPFPWQRRLVERVLRDGAWPAFLDLPTGAGKTAALDAAVFILAATASAGGRAPRRIVLVVDRRVIVDQASERASNLARTLAEPASSRGEPEDRQVVEEVAWALLRHVGGPRPLGVSVLRGGVPRDGSWAVRPDQATLLLSTVDQVGSRLLFRGYGVSDRMRPVHAGLLGSDTLYLLDEVHLSRPFAQTLNAIRSYRSEFDSDRAIAVVQMSATPGDSGDPGEVFTLGDDDRDHTVAPALATRLAATKSVHLVDVNDADGDTAAAIAAAVETHLSTLAGSTHAVVVNRVATARHVYERLCAQGLEAVLLTGRMRPLDRDAILNSYLPRIAAGRHRSPDDGPLVVVATQSIEAGADLDFDGLITELSPIDSLKQRLGRLDRLGQATASGISPQAVILAPRSSSRAKDPDPVYGGALVGAYRWLKQRYGKKPFDGGAESADLANPPAEAVAPTPDAPLLLPHHVDLLAQTNPTPAVDPPLWPWLHGPEERSSDVSVIWRGDADTYVDESTDAIGAVRASLVLLPPSAAEALQVPLPAVRNWLSDAPATDVSDVEGQRISSTEVAKGNALRVIRWRGSDDVRLVHPSALRPGDTVVVPNSYGGLDAGNWAPSSMAPVTDLASEANAVQRRRVVLRLRRDCLPAQWPDPPSIGASQDRSEARERIDAWLASTFAVGNPPAWLGTRPSAFRLHQLPSASGGVHYAVSWSLPVRPSDAGAVDDLDGSDLVNSFSAKRSIVPLEEHNRGVGALASDFAARLRLPTEIAADLELAGVLHDLGKADPRFQRGLHGGYEDDWPSDAPLLAKSPRFEAGDPESREAFKRSGYPPGSRHELLSVKLAAASETLRNQAHDWDLVLHLVATHHGHARPFPAAVHEPRPQRVAVTYNGETLRACTSRDAREHAETASRFWRTVRRYGWWGTAWLESLLRLADHRRSQIERETAADA